MGVNCSKNTKLKHAKQTFINLRSEVLITDKPFEIFFISDSYFFNILMKKFSNNQIQKDEFNKQNEITLIDNSSKIQPNNIYSQIIDPNRLNNSLNKDMKILFDFKTVIVMKQKEKATMMEKTIKDFILFLQNANVRLKKIYILENPLEKFYEKFDFFQKIEIFKEFFIFPAILFDFSDLIPLNNKSSKTQNSLFYVESIENFKKNFEKLKNYSIFLKVQSIMMLGENKNSFNSKEIEKMFFLNFCEIMNLTSVKNAKKILKKEISNNSIILFVFDMKKYKEFIDFLIDFLCKLLKCSSDSIIMYFKKIFPAENLMAQANNIFKTNNIKIEETPEKTLKTKNSKTIFENPIKNRFEEMTLLLSDMKKNINEMNLIIEILHQLINNIIKDPQNEKYRSIKSTNERLKKTLFSSHESKKLIELCGFFKGKDSVSYVNSLDVLNLKIIKSDFDLAAKNFLNKEI